MTVSYRDMKVFFRSTPTEHRQVCVSDLCNSMCGAESGRVSCQDAVLVCPVQIIYTNTNTGIKHSSFTVISLTQTIFKCKHLETKL